ncbi:hypothetical protein ACFSAG_07430 [Sphingorhabdus buctiana]|uniref:Uncharacterized protein n=1 Tax=Sphingorhabdus buctiana TaxID=1508805 RepID=A0ABW4MGM8_9SPHN
MYEKMLYGRRVLYFRYAPPVTNLDDTSARDTQPPYPNAPGYMWSVYYYWWAFLRLSERYKQCCDNAGEGELADLYTYFGDVRSDDFMRWWTKGGHTRESKLRMHTGRRLFSQGVRYPIREINDPMLDKELGADRIVLSIPIGTDLKRMTAEFQQLMRPIVEDRIRAFGEKKGEALFEVTSKNPSLKSLYKSLTAWEAKQNFPNLKQYELAKKLGITAAFSGDEGDVNHKIAVSTELKRRLDKAKLLIRNVERGRFPDFTDYEKPGKLVELPRALRDKVTKPMKPVFETEDFEEPTLI